MKPLPLLLFLCFPVFLLAEEKPSSAVLEEIDALVASESKKSQHESVLLLSNANLAIFQSAVPEVLKRFVEKNGMMLELEESSKSTMLSKNMCGQDFQKFGREDLQGEVLLKEMKKNFSCSPAFQSEIALQNVLEGKSSYQAGAMLRRRNFLEQSAQPGTRPQEFREYLGFDKGSFLRGASLLSFRFRGDYEDMFWLTSPMTGGLRLASETNRDDALWQYLFSFNDIFFPGARVQSLDVDSMTEEALFFPSAESLFQGKSVSGCLEVAPSEESSGEQESRWNVDTGRYFGGVGWLRSALPWRVTRVFRVKLETRDPFSPEGLIDLFLDAETLLPLMKVVYAKDASLHKVLFYGYSEVRAAGDQIASVPSFLIAFDGKSSASVLDFESWTLCDEAKAKEWETQLQPKALEE